jgi:flagellin-like protein
MKGITPIISIIVLLLITVSLAGAAYIFLGGYMTAYTGKALQVSNPGLCIGNTEAFITVTNMGTQPIMSLDACTAAGGETSLDCGDITVVRTDGGTFGAGAAFDDASIAAAQPGVLAKTTFRDPGCASGGPAICKYAFTRAGELQAAESTVSCSG